MMVETGSFLTKRSLHAAYRKHGFWLRVLFVAMLMNLGWGTSGSAWQFGNVPGLTIGRFIEPPRAIAQQMETAKESIDAERYADAVLILGDLLARDAIAAQDADLAGQDFFLDANTNVARGNLTKSLLREASELLADLPPSGLEIYELRFGAKAKQLLEEATQSGDRRILREIIRRYEHTIAGRSASWVLAHLELSEGRVVAALHLLRRLARQSVARDKYGDSLLVKLSEAEFLAERMPSAIEHLRAANQNGIDSGVTDVDVNAIAENELQDWLSDNFGTLSRSRPIAEDSTWVPQGGASGQGSHGGSLPLSVIRWDVPTITGIKQRRILEEYRARIGEEILPPSWAPIRVGSQLLMRTTERMMAVDFETGLRVWEFPWANGPEAVETRAQEWAMFDEPETIQDLLVQRVWNDLPYGRITSDGKRVYLLDDLGKLEPISFSGMRAGLRPSDASSNTLVCLDLASEGKLLWQRGASADEPDGENSLGSVFFLGPPLPVDDKLYQMAEIAGDTYLLCLEPSTGAELWRQQLLANEGVTVEANPLRRVGGAIPAYSEGVLVCPTAGGAIVAIDLATRAFLWGNYLPPNDAKGGFSNSRFRNRIDTSTLVRDRWLSGTPMIADGRVIVTPVEMDALYCYDLLTGEQVWPRILRSGYSYLAGTQDGVFLLVGPRQVMAFDLASGNGKWTGPVVLGDGRYVTGTGVFGDGKYLLPVSGGEIWEIELQTGAVTSKRETEFETGNLLAVGDSLVSQSATMLSVAYEESFLESRVDEVLQESPADAWALVRQGELLLQQGERKQAIEQFKKVREQAPDNELVRIRLVQAMLASIREGESASAETTQLLDELIELNPQRVELLRLKTDQALEDGRDLEAIDYLLALARVVLSEDSLGRSSNGLPSGSAASSTIDAWGAARFNQVYVNADAGLRNQIDMRLQPFVRQLLSLSPQKQRQVVRQFGLSPETDVLRNTLVGLAMDDGRWAEAERWLQDAIIGAERTNNAARRSRWQATLAEVYVEGDLSRDALAVLEGMAEAGVEFDPALEATRLRLQGTLSPHVWPEKIDVAATENRSVRGRSERTQVSVVSQRGYETRNWRPIADNMGIILLQDEAGMEFPIRFESPPWKNDPIQATIDGGLMVLLMNSELVAIDLLSFRSRPVDAVLWRRPWLQQVGGKTRSQSQQSFFKHNITTYRVSKSRNGELTEGQMRLGPLVGRRLYLLLGTDLVAIDASTNEEIWRSRDHAPDGYVIANQERVAVVSRESGVRVLRCEDGAELEARPWNPSETLIWASGEYVLTRENQLAEDATAGQQRVIRLQSPIGGEEVLTTTVLDDSNPSNEGAFARIIDGRTMVLVTLEGKLIIWDLQQGAQLCEHAIDVEANTTNIEVVPWNDSVLVGLVRPRKADANTMGSYTWGSEHAEISGPLYCVSLDDGEVRWKRDLDDAWGITLNQPNSSPLVFLSRSYRMFFDASRPKRTLDLMGLDLKTGETRFRIKDMEVQSSFNNLKTDLTVVTRRDLVDVAMQRYGFSLQFSDLPPGEEAGVVELDNEDIESLHREAMNPQNSENGPARIFPLEDPRR